MRWQMSLRSAIMQFYSAADYNYHFLRSMYTLILGVYFHFETKVVRGNATAIFEFSVRKMKLQKDNDT